MTKTSVNDSGLFVGVVLHKHNKGVHLGKTH